MRCKPLQERRTRSAASVVAAVVLAGCAGTEPSLKPSGDAERSKAAFMEMAKVMTHPRCLNCHARGDSPTRGDAMAPHRPPVVRGKAGMGAPGMRCSTCHGEANVTLVEGAGSVPGAPTWQLAPAHLAWQGKSASEICRELEALTRSGELSLEVLYERNRLDPLTAWAWQPGAGRSPAPGSQDELARHTRAWIDDGAHCPDP